MQRLIALAIMLALFGAPVFAQQKSRGKPQEKEVDIGRGMSFIAPSLMQIGFETNFFLTLADQIKITDQQRTAIEEIVFEANKYRVQRLADLNVADAELQRLLTRDKIDLDSVRAKIKEIGDVNADVKMREIELLLKAINALTHEQHLKIVTLAPAPKPQQQFN